MRIVFTLLFVGIAFALQMLVFGGKNMNPYLMIPLYVIAVALAEWALKCWRSRHQK
ncbi:MAG: hypothetical protein Q4C54_03800 [Clostridia bacterium]|nr:hypothetical protein [Clostridia bacterium]